MSTSNFSLAQLFKWSILLFGFFIIGHVSTAQDAQLDSLKNVLNTAKPDTNKVLILNEIAYLLLYEDNALSLEYAKQGLELSLDLDYKEGVGTSYKNAATSTFLSGDYANSMENYILALKVYEETDNQKMIAKTWGNIALIKFRQKNYTEALINLNKSIELKTEIGFEDGLANNYLTLASINYSQKDYNSAIENFKKANELASVAGKSRLQSACYNGIASIYLMQENYELSLKNYYEALEILIASNDHSRGICGIRHNIARAYREIGDYDKAIEELDKSLAGAKSIGSNEDIKQAYSGFDETYKMMGDTAKAYINLELYTIYKDSILNENVHNQINELQAKYDTEKKDQEIYKLTTEKETIKNKSILYKTILFSSIILLTLIIIVVVLYYRQRRIADSKRKIELEHRALRSQMNPHFIFNSLNSIQRMFIEGNQDIAVDYVGDFGSLLRVILENSGSSAISLHDEIETLKLYLDLEMRRTDGVIEYTIQIDEDIDQFNNNVPPLIIQPFVENAIWHGILPKEEKGLIQIKISYYSPNNIKCIIMDDGVGIDTSKSQKSIDGHKSMGIQLTKERLGADDSVIAEEMPNGGTKITLIIPSTV